MSKGSNTKASIINLALDFASRRGLESLSFGELAQEMKMSKSGLFAHFKSRENLQIMVFQRASDIFTEKVVKSAVRAPRGVPRIRAICENWIRWDTSGFPGGCPIITATIEFDDRPGRLREHVFKVQGEWISGLSFAAELAIAEGHFREDCDTKQFAYELYSFMLGFHLYKRMLNDPGAMSKSVAAFDDLLYRNYSEEYKRQLKVTENREIYS